jgi:hypothetical protein
VPFFNFFGAVLLLFFPLQVVGYTANGEMKIDWIADHKVTGLNKFIRNSGWKLGVFMMVLGFGFQIVSFFTRQ